MVEDRYVAREARADDEPGASLVAAMLRELEAEVGPLDLTRTPGASGAQMTSPGGAFFVVYEGARAVGCGGLKRWDATTGELKRMFVVPDARGRGVGRAILRALEEAARARGYRRVRLDTGATSDRAIRLYESAGYLAIPDYNGNAYAAHWYERELA